MHRNVFSPLSLFDFEQHSLQSTKLYFLSFSFNTHTHNVHIEMGLPCCFACWLLHLSVNTIKQCKILYFTSFFSSSSASLKRSIFFCFVSFSLLLLRLVFYNGCTQFERFELTGECFKHNQNSGEIERERDVLVYLPHFSWSRIRKSCLASVKLELCLIGNGTVLRRSN